MDMFRSIPTRAYLAYLSLRDREDGQAMVEYALLLSLIAIVSVGIVQTMGLSLSQLYSRINAVAFR